MAGQESLPGFFLHEAKWLKLLENGNIQIWVSHV